MLDPLHHRRHFTETQTAIRASRVLRTEVNSHVSGTVGGSQSTWRGTTQTHTKSNNPPPATGIEPLTFLTLGCNAVLPTLVEVEFQSALGHIGAQQGDDDVQSVMLSWSKPDMGKLKPRGHMWPGKLPKPAEFEYIILVSKI